MMSILLFFIYLHHHHYREDFSMTNLEKRCTVIRKSSLHDLTIFNVILIKNCYILQAGLPLKRSRKHNDNRLADKGI
jgi:hypothetical protein